MRIIFQTIKVRNMNSIRKVFYLLALILLGVLPVAATPVPDSTDETSIL